MLTRLEILFKLNLMIKTCCRKLRRDDSNNIEVYIGSENKLDDDVTVIKTNFKTDSEEGTLAIIGPTRMEYDRVVSILEYLKENIEKGSD